MAKMTQARVERWQKDLDKARVLIERVHADVGQAKLTTTGSIYSDVIDLGGTIIPALRNLEALVSPDFATSPIARIRRFVTAAADQRKAAKAAKDAERATAGV